MIQIPVFRDKYLIEVLAIGKKIKFVISTILSVWKCTEMLIDGNSLKIMRNIMIETILNLTEMLECVNGNCLKMIRIIS